MRNKVQILFLLCMFSFITQLFSQNNDGFDKANRILEKLVRKKKVPGIAITVTKKGETVLSKGYGYSNVEKKISVDPTATIFRIGSVSKPIAASGLAKMVEEERIDLEKSIHKYIADFPKKQYDFTIKQLGGHLAGIRNYKGNEFMNNEPLSIKAGVKLFENDPLLFQPGKDYAYTSYSLNLIALAIEETKGLPFEAYIQNTVLNPLEMFNTQPDKKEEIENKATFYLKPKKRRFTVAPEVDNYFKLAGGGYLSTSVDIAKLGNAYLKDDFLPNQIKNEFITSQEIGAQKTYYGIGWQASYDHKGRAYYGHIGNGLGGYGIFYVYPDSETVISILMNSSNPDLDKKFNQVIDAVFDEISKSES